MEPEALRSSFFLASVGTTIAVETLHTTPVQKWSGAEVWQRTHVQAVAAPPSALNALAHRAANSAHIANWDGALNAKWRNGQLRNARHPRLAPA